MDDARDPEPEEARRPRLVLPTARLEREFLAYAQEYASLGDGRYDLAAADFCGYLRDLERYARGQGLAPHHVAYTSYWLAGEDGGERILGMTNLRHRLNRRLLQEGGHIGYNIRPSQRRKGYGRLILALALAKARERGLRRVLVTCDTDNGASARIIQANGGVFENEVTSDRSGKAVSRYWIDVGM